MNLRELYQGVRHSLADLGHGLVNRFDEPTPADTQYFLTRLNDDHIRYVRHIGPDIKEIGEKRNGMWVTHREGRL